MTNTKFTLVYLNEYYRTNTVCNIIYNFFEIYARFEYKFKVYSTFRIELQDSFEDVEYKPFFSNQTKTRKEKVGTHVILVFDKELTEEELNLWRMFKIGFIIGISNGFKVLNC
jgi:hypothetical protein